jgi:hypothetical protein
MYPFFTKELSREVIYAEGWARSKFNADPVPVCLPCAKNTITIYTQLYIWRGGWQGPMTICAFRPK